MTVYIREVPDELREIINGINQAYLDGEYNHLPDPLEERDRLIGQYLTELTPERERP